ncbi:hypothetical protein Adt_25741 [Abeliophyllum distichum]|uniref:Uncharacterized protein n=1 Tax=Abeliophyllum distichum TaxID=126358 RepID=A0ABD1SI89_9LAMI
MSRREAEVASGLRKAPEWKCRFFPSEVNEGQLREWHQMYRVPDDVEFVVPGPNDRADDPPLGTCRPESGHPWRPGSDYPFPGSTSPVLRFGDFHSLYSFKSDGKRSGWWYASVKARTGRQASSLRLRTRSRIGKSFGSSSVVRGSLLRTTPGLISASQFVIHELRYVAREPTGESIERARRAREISESLRSSAVLITEENLISARLSRPLSDRPTAHRPKGSMKDISALLRKKNQRLIQAGRGKRKVPAGDQERSSRPRMESELPPRSENSPARSVEEVAAPTAIRPGPSSSQTVRPPAPAHLLGSNSPTREEIAGLPLSSRRAIRSVAKCWTPVQQKYLDGMGVVDSVVAASVNVSRAAIQLTSTSEKMARLVSEVQVMRDEGRKVLEELEDEKKLRAASEEILLRREEELNAKADELERAARARVDLEAELEAERKKNSELQDALEDSTAKEEAVAEFRSSDAYLAEQEVVYFLTMEELIDSTVEKRPDWDL